MRWLLAIAIVVLTGVHAHAEEPGRAVALLPLDADAKLELYGQPVASEVARALVQGGIEVVVVGPKMGVPAKARLIVDGTIKAGKGETIVITVRIRNARTGAADDPITVTAPSQPAMDHAAEELSAKVFPSVQSRLAAVLAEDQKTAPPTVTKPITVVQPSVKRQEMLIAVSAKFTDGEALSKALGAELVPWAARRHHDAKPATLGATAAKTVASRKADLAVELDVLEVEIEHDNNDIPLASAHVRLRISDPQSTVFDRVIVTSTVVGDKSLATDKLLARIAREVLDIADPHVRRRIPTWY